MSSRRHRALRRVGSYLAAALILVPLLLGGHRHSTDLGASSTACAACVATHHSPAVWAPALPQLSPTLHGLAVSSSHDSPLSQTYRPFKAGRAPPASSTAQPV